MENKTQKLLLILAVCLLLTISLQTSSQRSFAQEQMPMPDAATMQALAMLTTTDSPIPLSYPTPPAEYESLINPLTSESASLINLDDFRSDSRFADIDGSGVAVVVLDTGIDLDNSFFGPDSNHDGVSDRIVYHWDFADNDNNATDVNGHGSNVSSIVGSSHEIYRGMAPGVDLIHLKVFSDSGSGNFGNVEAALSWVVANATTYNIVSVNMSLGDSGNHTDTQERYGVGDEMAALTTLGVTVVSSSGNSFYSYGSQQGVGYPSADANSLSIGAVYDSNTSGWSYSSGAQAYSASADNLTPFSQRHQTMSTIFAPGAPIIGAGPTGGLTIMHGTSQSSPHIAGIIALMQQLAHREMGRYLTVAEVETYLVSTAVSIVDGDDENDNVSNTGLTFPRVDVMALGEALLSSEDTTPPQVSQIASNIETGNGISDENTVNANISQLAVTFNESVQNPAGDDAPNDVTNTANYMLVADGEDGLLETAVCGNPIGDDSSIIINSVTYNNGTKTAVIGINNGEYLPENNYRFFVCKETLQDLAGNYLGSDNDFSLTFTVQTPEMIFLPMITN